MKFFKIIVLCTISNLSINYSTNAAALPPELPCSGSYLNGQDDTRDDVYLSETDYEKCCTCAKRMHFDNSFTLNFMLNHLLKIGNVSFFSALLQEYRIVTLLTPYTAERLLILAKCNANLNFMLALLANNYFVEMLGGKILDREMCFATVYSNNLIIQAMLNSPLIISLITPPKIAKCFVHAAQAGNIDVLNVFLTPTETFDFTKMFDAQTINNAIQSACKLGHIEAVLLLRHNQKSIKNTHEQEKQKNHCSIA